MAIGEDGSPKDQVAETKLPEIVVPTTLMKHGSCRPLPPGKELIRS